MSKDTRTIALEAYQARREEIDKHKQEKLVALHDKAAFDFAKFFPELIDSFAHSNNNPLVFSDTDIEIVAVANLAITQIREFCLVDLCPDCGQKTNSEPIDDLVSLGAQLTDFTPHYKHYKECGKNAAQLADHYKTALELTGEQSYDQAAITFALLALVDAIHFNGSA